MIRDQYKYKRAKEIEAELIRVQGYINDIEPLRRAEKFVIAIRPVYSSVNTFVLASNNTAKEFVETVYHEYMDRKKKLEEEFESL